jgi:hypothetical protein
VAEGRFVDGVLMGSGSLRESDGSRYVGTFARNKLNGRGVKIMQSFGSELRYVGDWENGDLKIGILYADCFAASKGVFERDVLVSPMELNESDYPCK